MVAPFDCKRLGTYWWIIFQNWYLVFYMQIADFEQIQRFTYRLWVYACAWVCVFMFVCLCLLVELMKIVWDISAIFSLIAEPKLLSNQAMGDVVPYDIYRLYEHNIFKSSSVKTLIRVIRDYHVNGDLFIYLCYLLIYFNFCSTTHIDIKYSKLRNA